jgi:hypothetical protein
VSPILGRDSVEQRGLAVEAHQPEQGQLPVALEKRAIELAAGCAVAGE